MRNLNLKSDEAYELASRVAKTSGTSLTQAVIDALRDRDRALRKQAISDKWDRIIAENRANLTPEIRDFDADAFLYDEDGLPH